METHDQKQHLKHWIFATRVADASKDNIFSSKVFKLLFKRKKNR